MEKGGLIIMIEKNKVVLLDFELRDSNGVLLESRSGIEPFPVPKSTMDLVVLFTVRKLASSTESSEKLK
jgi:FKBP-type peptidyl-prolyl cis-trans isomerase 2